MTEFLNVVVDQNDRVLQWSHPSDEDTLGGLKDEALYELDIRKHVIRDIQLEYSDEYNFEDFFLFDNLEKIMVGNDAFYPPRLDRETLRVLGGKITW